MFSATQRRLDELLERLVVLEATINGIAARVESLESTPTTGADPELERKVDDLCRAHDVLERLIGDQTIAIAEGIERVDRAERRIKATVQSARRKLAESGHVDDRVEAEAAQLHLEHGGGGLGNGVPPLSDDVEDPGDQGSSVPGVSIAQLQRARGLV